MAGHKFFFHGKDYPKSNLKNKPLQGAPNSFLDTYSVKSGRFVSRRKFGADGLAYKDLDVADNHRPYDHVHKIHGTKRSINPDHPNKQERLEFKKAKKKRSFFDD